MLDYVSKLEHKLKEKFGVEYFIVTGFSRNALYLLLKALESENVGLDGEPEIIVPAFTCPVISATIRSAGYKPVPVDSYEDNINISHLEIEKSLTDKTKAIYIVHTYGQAAEVEKIAAMAKKKGIILIEDLAHSIFVKKNGRYLGTFGDYMILSFTKKIINFEGGAIGTSNKKNYEKMRDLQSKLHEDKALSFEDILDKYARIAGSWWESTFSIVPLFIMKINDVVNSIIYKGAYGMDLNKGRFFPSNLASHLTLLQIDSVFKKKRKGFPANIEFSLEEKENPSKNISADYLTFIPKKNNMLNRFFSFRTWHDFNERGKYPNAEKLHSGLRIFSKVFWR